MLQSIIKEVIKEILLNQTSEFSIKTNDKGTITSSVLGKICMIRTYSAGIHFGKVEAKEGKEICLSKARRIFYWKGACSLSQLAMEGSQNINECQISISVEKIILEYIEIIPMTKDAINNLIDTKGLWKK